MSDENKNIENNQEENQNKCEDKKSCWVKTQLTNLLKNKKIILIISFIFIINVILFVKFFLEKQEVGHFEYLNGSYGQTAVVLNENEILLPSAAIGNRVIEQQLLSAQIYNLKQRKFKSLNVFMNIPRTGYLATLLDDGRVLIWGGTRSRTKKPGVEQNAEIYNTNSNKFELIGRTNFKHDSLVNSNFIKLKDGRIFMITYDKAEIFDPKTNKFSFAGTPKKYYQKSEHDKNQEKEQIRTTNNIYNRRTALALLNDGKVLLVGSNLNLDSNNAEIYNPDTNEFVNVGSQNFPMFYREATTLKDGRVLVTGGTKMHYKKNIKLRSKLKQSNAEIFNPETNLFEPIESLNLQRAGHRSILLNNGKVLIVNGYSGSFLDTKNTKQAEIYDPIKNDFKLIGKTKMGRFSFSLVPINNKTVLINSYNGWEIYKY